MAMAVFRVNTVPLRFVSEGPIIDLLKQIHSINTTSQNILEKCTVGLLLKQTMIEMIKSFGSTTASAAH